MKYIFLAVLGSLLVIAVIGMADPQVKLTPRYSPENLGDLRETLAAYKATLNSDQAVEIHKLTVVSDALVEGRDKTREILLSGIEKTETALDQATSSLLDHDGLISMVDGLSNTTITYIRLLDVQASLDVSSEMQAQTQTLRDQMFELRVKLGDTYTDLYVDFIKRLKTAQQVLDEQVESD